MENLELLRGVEKLADLGKLESLVNALLERSQVDRTTSDSILIAKAGMTICALLAAERFWRSVEDDQPPKKRQVVALRFVELAGGIWPDFEVTTDSHITAVDGWQWWCDLPDFRHLMEKD